MSAIASQITSLTIVYSAVYSGADQRKHQSSVSLTFVRGIHRSPVISPHKGPVTRKMFPFDDVITMWHYCYGWVSTAASNDLAPIWHKRAPKQSNRPSMQIFLRLLAIGCQLCVHSYPKPNMITPICDFHFRLLDLVCIFSDNITRTTVFMKPANSNNTIVTSALVPCVSRISCYWLVLVMRDRYIIVLHMENFY